MLIYEALKKDHEAMRSILKDLDVSSDAATAQRRDLVEQLRQELLPHTRSEEKVLYDTLKEISGTEELALEAYEEHAAAETLLRELSLMDPADERWHAKLKVLKETLENHLEGEEAEIFEAASQVLATEEAEMMTEAFLNLKEQIKAGSLLHTALEKIGQYMPVRFAGRFADLSRRI
jgi:hemerythrin-like domain-containing protein